MLLDLSPQLNIVLGDNATGKSSLARAVRDTLWPSDTARPVVASSRWRDGDDREHKALLLHGAVTWEPGPPELPSGDGAPLHQLGMAQLNEGQIPEAIVSFETYLKLAPQGEFAAQATAMVAQLKP